MDNQELQGRFSYSKATTVEQSEKHGRVYQEFPIFAEFLNHLIPDSREKSLALTALEESMVWANKAIARNGGQ